MDITIKPGLKGARTAKGIAVIIDVFRAGNTILACLKNGVKEIIPIEQIEKAYKLKQLHRSWILVGERNGKKISNFDYGNSPATLASLNIYGKTIVLSTSSGTKGLLHAKFAEKCYIASFGNISKMVSFLKEKNSPVISLVPMGLNATISAVEDDLCAQYMYHLLQNKPVNYEKILVQIKKGSGMKRLLRLGQQADIKYCLDKDRFPLIAEYDLKRQTIIRKDSA